MTSYLLDTNIVSNATKPKPSPALATWMMRQRDADLFVSSLTIAEIRRGVLDAPAGRKRRALEAWFDGDEGRRGFLPTVSCRSTSARHSSGRGSCRKQG